jgi:hypothetical protein
VKALCGFCSEAFEEADYQALGLALMLHMSSQHTEQFAAVAMFGEVGLYVASCNAQSDDPSFPSERERMKALIARRLGVSSPARATRPPKG